MFYSALQPLIVEYGLIAVFMIVMLESAGLPLPGETALVLAAVYAGMTGHFEIPVVIAVAATAAIIGDNIGFALGRRYGMPLVARYGQAVGLDERGCASGNTCSRNTAPKSCFSAASSRYFGFSRPSSPG